MQRTYDQMAISVRVALYGLIRPSRPYRYNLSGCSYNVDAGKKPTSVARRVLKYSARHVGKVGDTIGHIWCTVAGAALASTAIEFRYSERKRRQADVRGMKCPGAVQMSV